MEQTHENPDGKAIHLFELLTLFVFLTGFAGVGLLTLNKFDSLYTLIIGAFLTLLVFKTFKCQLQLKDQRFDLYLLGILLIALFFTAKPYLHVMGGQDQGLYINMSATYERTGSTFIKDNLRASLAEGEKNLYDANNFYHLGVYTQDLNESKYVYQFYPLHPIWLAIFGKIFGPDNRVYSLVFFSLISLVTLFLLACELSNGEKTSGYLMAIFLAVNPLFTFFSKFPLSEIVMLAFSSLGFYYLLRYYRKAKEGQRNVLYLLLSALAFFSLFFVHISGFFYMPIFYVLLILTLLYITDHTLKRRLIFYYFSVFFGYFLSIIYGLIYSPVYANDIYRLELSRLLVINPTVEIALGIVLAFSLPFVVIRYRNHLKNLAKHWQSYVFTLLAFFIFLLIPLNILQANSVGIDLRTTSSYITMLYLTPFGVVLYLLGLKEMRKRHETPVFILLLLLLLFWTAKAFGSISINYQYYGARYLFNEVFVYSLLVVALYAGHLFRSANLKRLCAVFMVAGILLYSAYFTSFQLQGQEADGSNQALKLVAAELDEKDLLVSTFSDNEVTTPLAHYFGLNVFVLPKEKLSDTDLTNTFLNTFNDVFVLSNGPLANTNLETVNMIAYKQGIFERPATRIPKEFFYHRLMNLYLYKISRYDYFTSVIRPSNFKLVNFYGDQWTNGNGIITDIGIKLPPDNMYIILQTAGHNPLREDLERLKLQLLVNNTELKFNRRDGNDYYFKLDARIQEISEITINSATWIPKEFGINEDTRALGVDVVSLAIK